MQRSKLKNTYNRKRTDDNCVNVQNFGISV